MASKIRVKFLRSYHSYNGGECAGFSPELADELERLGVVEKIVEEQAAPEEREAKAPVTREVKSPEVAKPASAPKTKAAAEEIGERSAKLREALEEPEKAAETIKKAASEAGAKTKFTKEQAAESLEILSGKKVDEDEEGKK